MNTFEFIKMIQVSKPTRRSSSYFPEFPKKSEYNDCGEIENEDRDDFDVTKSL